MNQSEIDSLLESKVSRRRHLKSLEYGVGHYDVEFPSTIIIDGIMCHHSAHRRWSGMPTEFWPRDYESVLKNELMKAVGGEDGELAYATASKIAKSVINAGFSKEAANG